MRDKQREKDKQISKQKWFTDSKNESLSLQKDWNTDLPNEKGVNLGSRFNTGPEWLIDSETDSLTERGMNISHECDQVNHGHKMIQTLIYIKREEPI